MDPAWLMESEVKHGRVVRINSNANETKANWVIGDVGSARNFGSGIRSITVWSAIFGEGRDGSRMESIASWMVPNILLHRLSRDVFAQGEDLVQ